MKSQRGTKGAALMINEDSCINSYCDGIEEIDLHTLVKMNFMLEAIGVTTNNRKSDQDKRVEQVLAENTRRIGERWETGLLWKDDSVRMPDNKSYAYKRLKSIERKMDRDPEYGKNYEKEVENLIQAGYAKKVDQVGNNGRIWYLPHFGVTNPNKPGKLRLVFDGSAETHGVSLNNQLLTGPDLVKPLLGVLMRFRLGKIAFTGDIKEMFSQVKICKKDQSSQLFLWRGWERDSEPTIYAMTSMMFGAASSPHMAQYIKNRNAREFEDLYPDAVKAILEKHYVDDYLDSVENVEQAVRRIKEVTKIHKNGGFEIRGWASNSEEVLNTLPDTTLAKGAINLNMDQEHIERTLGLIWDPVKDIIVFDLSLKKIPEKIAKGIENPTKRETLRVIISVYDPLGILSPFSIRAKILLQDVWKSGIDWDERLLDKEFSRWLAWIHNLDEAKQYEPPRCYRCRNENPKKMELHVFCDASDKVYSAVAYWRIIYSNGENDVSFIVGKSRVAPLKPTSIPRMELQGALLASRLARTILEEHQITVSERVFWTDSTNILGWIRADPRKYQAFVAHRLGEIDELTNANEWRWVPTKLNPADVATRDHGSLREQMSKWILGPKFLVDRRSSWPSQPKTNDVKEPSQEKKTEYVAVLTEESEYPLPNIDHFTKWLCLIRSTAWVLLVPRIWRTKQKLKPTVELMEQAERLWILKAQQETFGTEIQAEGSHENIPKSSKLYNLSIILDKDGILRTDGRIAAAKGIRKDMKFPIILDGQHCYTKLLIQHQHEKFAHGSSEKVVNELRQRFWIIKIRPAVKSVTTKCGLCRIRKAEPEIPRMGNLPNARLGHHQRPFMFSGIDYFGPMHVTIGRRHEKRWGVLITCLTTRAIHIEIANSLSTDSAIMAVRRMIARRGTPSEMYSDNGTNFRGASTELQNAINEINQDMMYNEMTNRGIKWKFIPPMSPHMGGSWERLVRSVKVALNVVLKERSPKEEILATLLTEVEHIVNSRPLTHVSVNQLTEESLTPNHFLIGTSSAAPIPGKFTDDDLFLRKQWRIAQRLADMFWSRWIKEYLPNLVSRKCWNQDVRPLAIGDIVLIVDSSLPRNMWIKGVIIALFPGKDGRVRVVDVRIKGGHVLKRAAAKLIVLATQDN